MGFLSGVKQKISKSPFAFYLCPVVESPETQRIQILSMKFPGLCKFLHNSGLQENDEIGEISAPKPLFPCPYFPPFPSLSSPLCAPSGNIFLRRESAECSHAKE